jgi:hypothetical protein
MVMIDGVSVPAAAGEVEAAVGGGVGMGVWESGGEGACRSTNSRTRRMICTRP